VQPDRALGGVGRGSRQLGFAQFPGCNVELPTVRVGEFQSLEIAQLEYFLAIVEYKKFFLAAEHLFMSQSSLSKQIRALEQELGVRLFDRGRGSVELTPAGRTFLPFARDVRERHQ